MTLKHVYTCSKEHAAIRPTTFTRSNLQLTVYWCYQILSTYLSQRGDNFNLQPTLYSTYR